MKLIVSSIFPSLFSSRGVVVCAVSRSDVALLAGCRYRCRPAPAVVAKPDAFPAPFAPPQFFYHTRNNAKDEDLMYRT